jgi:hypothetical protein
MLCLRGGGFTLPSAPLPVTAPCSAILSRLSLSLSLVIDTSGEPGTVGSPGVELPAVAVDTRRVDGVR